MFLLKAIENQCNWNGKQTHFEKQGSFINQNLESYLLNTNEDSWELKEKWGFVDRAGADLLTTVSASEDLMTRYLADQAKVVSHHVAQRPTRLAYCAIGVR